jgi:hypothetical protein
MRHVEGCVPSTSSCLLSAVASSLTGLLAPLRSPVRCLCDGALGSTTPVTGTAVSISGRHAQSQPLRRANPCPLPPPPHAFPPAVSSSQFMRWHTMSPSIRQTWTSETFTALRSPVLSTTAPRQHSSGRQDLASSDGPVDPGSRRLLVLPPAPNVALCPAPDKLPPQAARVQLHRWQWGHQHIQWICLEVGSSFCFSNNHS